MKRFLGWLFAPSRQPRTSLSIIAWWEIRRLPFNLIIGTYGGLALSLFYWAIQASGPLKPGEDAVEPIGLLVAPFAINVLYSLGWLVEIQLPSSPWLGPLLLKLGLGLGLLLITLPAAFWLGYRLMQLVGITP